MFSSVSTSLTYLRECGFHVFEAGGAEDAIKILISDTEVDLVFSDIQMPGEMDGFGLSQWIKTHRPELKVILTSGYAKAAEKAHDLCIDGPLMGKPYDLTHVVSRIRSMLGRLNG